MFGRTALLTAACLLVARPSASSWTPGGTPVCTESHLQNVPAITADGAGGAIISWYDMRNGSSDIYAEHVLASGEMDPAWPLNGSALCTAAGDQVTPKIAPDGAGGAIVVWEDFRGTDDDIYAQHVLSTGAVDPAWPADGLPVSTTAENQTQPAVVSDGAGGAFVA